MHFVGRQNSVRELNKKYYDDKADLILITGRRRVGKSRLIFEFLKDKKNNFHFTGVESKEVRKKIPHKDIQIRNVLSTLSLITKKDTYKNTRTSSWDECLTYIDDCLPKDDIPCSIVLDEFPWLASYRLELVRALFKFWELQWAHRKKFMLIICGSTVGFLDKHFIKSTQFYGRATSVIHLDPLNLHEVRDFFGTSRTNEEILELYMVFGGVPKYLEQIHKKDSVRATINNLCFQPKSFFIEEIPHLFRSSFIRQSIKYQQIVSSLVRAHSLTYEELAQTTKSAKGSSFKQILDNLINANIIQKTVPVDREGTTNLFRLHLSDEFTRFYFQFIEPQLNIIQHNEGGKDLFDLLFPQKKYFTWKGRAFERIVYKHAIAIAEFLSISVVVKNFGPYFNRKISGSQIDLVFVRTDKTVTACEIKYSENPLQLNKKLLEQLQSQKVFLKEAFPSKRIEQILITNTPPSETLLHSDAIHHVVNVCDIIENKGEKVGTENRFF